MATKKVWDRLKFHKSADNQRRWKNIDISKFSADVSQLTFVERRKFSYYTRFFPMSNKTSISTIFLRCLDFFPVTNAK